MRRFWYRDTQVSKPAQVGLTAGERADWVQRDPQGYFDHMHEEAQKAAQAAVAARLASEKFHRKYNRWFRRLWRHLKR